MAVPEAQFQHAVALGQDGHEVADVVHADAARQGVHFHRPDFLGDCLFQLREQLFGLLFIPEVVLHWINHARVGAVFPVKGAVALGAGPYGSHMIQLLLQREIMYRVQVIRGKIAVGGVGLAVLARAGRLRAHLLIDNHFLNTRAGS